MAPVDLSLQHDFSDQQVQVIGIVDQSQGDHVQCFLQLVLSGQNQCEEMRHVHHVHYSRRRFHLVCEPEQHHSDKIPAQSEEKFE